MICLCSYGCGYDEYDIYDVIWGDKYRKLCVEYRKLCDELWESVGSGFEFCVMDLVSYEPVAESLVGFQIGVLRWDLEILEGAFELMC